MIASFLMFGIGTFSLRGNRVATVQKSGTYQIVDPALTYWCDRHASLR